MQKQIFVIPILFILFQWLQEKITGAPTEKLENIEENISDEKE